MELLKQLPSVVPSPVYPEGTHQLAVRNLEHTGIDTKAVTFSGHYLSKGKGNLFLNPQIISHLDIWPRIR